MSFKRKPAGSLDSMSTGGGIGSSEIEQLGDMLVNIGELMQTIASGGSSDS
ncbi:MAG: hypothetical protein L0H59_07560 [Tomitella sp.]|nr:hypothetical protein [Tomitella sp.]